MGNGVNMVNGQNAQNHACNLKKGYAIIHHQLMVGMIVLEMRKSINFAT